MWPMANKGWPLKVWHPGNRHDELNNQTSVIDEMNGRIWFRLQWKQMREPQKEPFIVHVGTGGSKCSHGAKHPKIFKHITIARVSPASNCGCQKFAEFVCSKSTTGSLNKKNMNKKNTPHQRHKSGFERSPAETGVPSVQVRLSRTPRLWRMNAWHGMRTPVTHTQFEQRVCVAIRTGQARQILSSILGTQCPIDGQQLGHRVHTSSVVYHTLTASTTKHQQSNSCSGPSFCFCDNTHTVLMTARKTEIRHETTSCRFNHVCTKQKIKICVNSRAKVACVDWGCLYTICKLFVIL